jgi:hypothetical protein
MERFNLDIAAILIRIISLPSCIKELIPRKNFRVMKKQQWHEPVYDFSLQWFNRTVLAAYELIFPPHTSREHYSINAIGY